MSTLYARELAGHSIARLKRAAAPLQGPLLLAAAYFLAAEAAFAVGTLSDKIFALFWPPNVVLFCALMLVPPQQWWLYIAAAFPAHVAAEVGVGMPAAQLALAFATNCTVALLNAAGVRRWVGGPPWFGTFQAALKYVVIVLVGPAIAALGGAFVPILGGGALHDYSVFWAYWYMGNVLASLTLGPVFLIWFADGAGWTWRRLSRQDIEQILIAILLAGIYIILSETATRFSHTGFLPALLLAPLPIVLFATVRHGEKGASAAILIITVIMTVRMLRGSELFPGQPPEHSVLALQVFLSGLCIPLLLLGASIEELRRAGETTRRLSFSLMRAQDEERRRIARELHDSTGQNLIAGTLVAGRIQRALPASAQPLLTELESLLQQSIREVRTVSYLLHPPLLDEAGLESALRFYIEGYAARSGIAVGIDIDSDFGRLPPEIELTLFRVVQEALSNVSRHSNSRTARIRLHRVTMQDGKWVELTIADKGVGVRRGGSVFTANRPLTQGVGLASMRERIEQIGGIFDIRSADGGTQVMAAIPLRR